MGQCGWLMGGGLGLFQARIRTGIQGSSVVCSTSIILLSTSIHDHVHLSAYRHPVVCFLLPFLHRETFSSCLCSSLQALFRHGRKSREKQKNALQGRTYGSASWIPGTK